MPELSKITARVCNTAKGWERQVLSKTTSNIYHVRYRKLQGHHGPIMGYTCTCPSFTHRGGVCKHIKEVVAERCGYGEDAFAGSPEDDWDISNADGSVICPKCGGPTFVVEVAI